MNKGKKIKENWARVEIFGICFLLIFYRYCLQFILKGRLGNGFCPRSISRFPNDSFFLKLLVLSLQKHVRQPLQKDKSRFTYGE